MVGATTFSPGRFRLFNMAQPWPASMNSAQASARHARSRGSLAREIGRAYMVMFSSIVACPRWVRNSYLASGNRASSLHKRTEITSMAVDSLLPAPVSSPPDPAPKKTGAPKARDQGGEAPERRADQHARNLNQ